MLPRGAGEQSLFADLAASYIGPTAVIVLSLEVLVRADFVIIGISLAQAVCVSNGCFRSRRELFEACGLLRGFVKLVFDAADL